jgi:hypothetical protein
MNGAARYQLAHAGAILGAPSHFAIGIVRRSA